MPFDTSLSQDAAAIQQGEYQALWDAARYRQGHPQQHQNQDQIPNYVHQDLNIQNQGLNQAPQVEDNPHHIGNAHYNLEPQRAPTWLSAALSRQSPEGGIHIERCPVCASRGLCICSTPRGPSASFLSQLQYTQSYLAAGIGSSRQFEKEGGLQWGIGRGQVTELDLAAAHGRGNAPEQGQGHPGLFQQPDLGQRSGAAGLPGFGGGFCGDYGRAADWDDDMEDWEANWEEIRKRCMVATHPKFPEMVARHVELLRVSTPVDQLADLEAQLIQAPRVTEKYRMVADRIGEVTPDEQEELDQFMNGYPTTLASLKDTLQKHIYVDVTEAMISCWEMEQALIGLTGVRLETGSGAMMSDDDEDYDSDFGSYEQGMDFSDGGGFGPLVPTETERSLMERVRKELKQELKQGYKSKIEDVREEILRKRRAGKLPEGTTTVLKAWWQAHAKWPYPTEDEKEVLIQETGLELKQINNWFINQRKRNWHSNPLANNNNNSGQTSSSSKNKARKSW